MSIQVVIILIQKLCDKYGHNKDLYKNRYILDKAFSTYEKFEKDKAIHCINAIDEKFFTLIDDDKVNIKAFLFYILKTNY